MTTMITRPESYAVRAYEATKVQTMTSTDLQRIVFNRAVEALKRIKEVGARDMRDFHTVLTDNRRLWTEVATQVARNPQVSLELAQSMNAIAQSVIHHTTQVVSGRANVDPLIQINAEMRDLRRGLVFSEPNGEAMPICDA